MLEKNIRSSAVLLIAIMVFVLAGCEQSGPAGAPAPSSSITNLKITDIVEGQGTVAEAGKSVQVHYTGWLYDESAKDFKGTKFDSSRDRGQPLSFPLGAGRVIPGWEQGIEGMKTGGQRHLVIPSHLAYGERGAGRAIPPNATLFFEVELIEVR